MNAKDQGGNPQPVQPLKYRPVAEYGNIQGHMIQGPEAGLPVGITLLAYFVPKVAPRW